MIVKIQSENKTNQMIFLNIKVKTSLLLREVFTFAIHIYILAGGMWKKLRISPCLVANINNIILYVNLKFRIKKYEKNGKKV